MGFGKLLRNAGRLRPRQRTNRVDEAAAGLERVRGVIAERALHDREFLDVLQLRGPTRIRIALPDADAAAGRVDEYAVELGSGGQARAPVPFGRPVIENSGAGGAFLELRQSARRAIRRPEA